MKIIKHLLLFIIAIVLLNGCTTVKSWFKPEPLKSEEILFEQGSKNFDNKYYDEAIDFFQELIDRFPYSSHAIVAELKIADAYFHNKEYENAKPLYKMFEELHPENDNLPHVVYHLGLCYYFRMKGADRDQTSTYQAIHHFQRFILKFPSSELIPEVRAKLIKTRLKALDSELYVADFYSRTAKYNAASKRLKKIQDNFSDIITPDIQKKIDVIKKRCKNKHWIHKL